MKLKPMGWNCSIIIKNHFFLSSTNPCWLFILYIIYKRDRTYVKLCHENGRHILNLQRSVPLIFVVCLQHPLGTTLTSKQNNNNLQNKASCQNCLHCFRKTIIRRQSQYLGKQQIHSLILKALLLWNQIKQNWSLAPSPDATETAVAVSI